MGFGSVRTYSSSPMLSRGKNATVATEYWPFLMDISVSDRLLSLQGQPSSFKQPSHIYSGEKRRRKRYFDLINLNIVLETINHTKKYDNIFFFFFLSPQKRISTFFFLNFGLTKKKWHSIDLLRCSIWLLRNIA